MILTSKQDAIAKVLFHWFKIKQKKYGIISQGWLMKTVEKAHGITMSRRTLNRCLARLRELGVVYTEQRHRRDPESGEFIPDVSIYYFTDELKDYINKVFRFFKKLFGFQNLTEYTVPALSPSPRSIPEANPSQKNDPPPKTTPIGRGTNWAALGLSRKGA